ncbi:MAG: MinD/ParA family protein [Candidatus Micrarchaeota archaeon]|nr:MinD/ParA family protein [Candidatus Micrarchaeota archaeon]
MAQPYLVRVSSQKGGVGKTTISVNLAIILKALGYSVLLVDDDYVNPVVAMHLGLEEVGSGFRAVQRGRTRLASVTTIHPPTGLHVLCGELSQKQYDPNPESIARFARMLHQTKYDFVVMDTPPGFTKEVFVNIDEALIVMTPDMQATTSAIRSSQIFDRYHIRHSLVVNRVRRRAFELSPREIESAYGARVEAAFPEDDSVPMSIAAHIPAYLYRKRAPFSRAMLDFSRIYSARGEQKESGAGGQGFLSRLLGLFRRG